MTAHDVDLPPDGASYLRGGGAGSNGPRMIRLFLGGCLVALAALVVVLFVQAAAEGSRADRLHRHGVTVVATVTGCLGIASGTGITEASFQCKASFVDGGRRYTEVIRGSSALLQTGSAVTAVVVPGDPRSLSGVGAAAGGHSQSAWSRYLPAAISLAALVISAIAFRVGGKRRGDSKRSMM
jgi:hypothetical protein